MTNAPPIEPGTPRRNARPSTPAFAAALATILVRRGGPGDDATVVHDLDRAEGPAAEPYDEAGERRRRAR